MTRGKPWDDTERGRDAVVAAAFGAELRARRRAVGLTQGALAEAAELSVSAVSLIERGGRQPSLGASYRLSVALGLGRAALAEAAAERLDGGEGGGSV